MPDLFRLMTSPMFEAAMPVLALGGIWQVHRGRTQWGGVALLAFALLSVAVMVSYRMDIVSVYVLQTPDMRWSPSRSIDAALVVWCWIGGSALFTALVGWATAPRPDLASPTVPARAWMMGLAAVGMSLSDATPTSWAMAAGLTVATTAWWRAGGTARVTVAWWLAAVGMQLLMSVNQLRLVWRLSSDVFSHPNSIGATKAMAEAELTTFGEPFLLGVVGATVLVLLVIRQSGDAKQRSWFSAVVAALAVLPLVTISSVLGIVRTIP